MSGKQAKTLVMAIRVTQAEMDAFDANHVHGGRLRSEVIRSKLGISEARRKRGELSESDAYDYQRALLIKNSTNKIALIVESLDVLKDDSERIAALPVVKDLVFREIKKVEAELDALQLKSGVTNKNPAHAHIQNELTSEVTP